MTFISSYLRLTYPPFPCLQAEDFGLPPQDIVGGKEAEEENLPYLVSFGLKTLERSTPGGHACTGTLIKPDVVLSAARKLRRNRKNINSS